MVGTALTVGRAHARLTVFIALFCAASSAHGIIIEIDYRYDTNSFFDTQAKKDALSVVADRFSGIITSHLLPVGPSGTGSGTPAGWRIGFTHPGTGASYQVSTATSTGTDPIVGILGAGFAANEYGFAGLSDNVWILYAGGRTLGGPAGVGGTGTGINFTSTFDDLSGPLHRGVISNMAGGGSTVNDLPAWGGSISFDTSLSWHFDTTTAATGTDVDFYSIALHEIGHALGLNLGFNQFTQYQSGSSYSGPNAVAAYNADNGTSVTSLNLVSSTNRHWEDGTYDSKIFSLGTPNYVGTVGAGILQDLLMEPSADFIDPTLRRFELTNVDVGELRDLGWTIIPEASVFSFGLLAGGVFGCCHGGRLLLRLVRSRAPTI